jgi:hypothetical protein
MNLTDNSFDSINNPNMLSSGHHMNQVNKMKHMEY